MHWRYLLVYHEPGKEPTWLKDMVDDPESYCQIKDIELNEHGGIESWPGYFVATIEEKPDWDTPRDVDWTGFKEIFEIAKKRLDKMKQKA